MSLLLSLFFQVTCLPLHFQKASDTLKGHRSIQRRTKKITDWKEKDDLKVIVAREGITEQNVSREEVWSLSSPVFFDQNSAEQLPKFIQQASPL